jgi:membrane protease YdiL (CAAX protease family)
LATSQKVLQVDLLKCNFFLFFTELNTDMPVANRSILHVAWKKLPVIIRAIIVGVLVTATVTLPWAWLVSMNLKHLPSVPWSVVPTIALLWLFWQYFIKGKGWPRSTAFFRKLMGRGNPLSAEGWGAAILAGILGLVSLLFFSGVISRMIQLPQQESSGLEQVPPASLFLMLLTGSAVAGITEETGFRGYMQKPVEGRHGPIVAILITGITFGLMHFSHPETTLALMPFYFFAATVYGMLAYLTNSILPGLVLHAAGDVFSGLNLFTRGQSEWQTSPKPLIWNSGPDVSFWLSLLGFFLVGSITVWAYFSLWKLVKKEDRNPG